MFKLIICPTSTPKVTPRGHSTPIGPLTFIGANSIRYIGIILVAKPKIMKISTHLQIGSLHQIGNVENTSR